MAKLTAWLITLIGVLLILAMIWPTVFTGIWFGWIVALIVLIVGISKLIRNYTYKKK